MDSLLFPINVHVAELKAQKNLVFCVKSAKNRNMEGRTVFVPLVEGRGQHPFKSYVLIASESLNVVQR